MRENEGDEEPRKQGFPVESWQREKRCLIAASSAREPVPLAFPSYTRRLQKGGRRKGKDVEFLRHFDF